MVPFWDRLVLAFQYLGHHRLLRMVRSGGAQSMVWGGMPARPSNDEDSIFGISSIKKTIGKEICHGESHDSPTEGGAVADRA